MRSLSRMNHITVKYLKIFFLNEYFYITIDINEVDIDCIFE